MAIINTEPLPPTLSIIIATLNDEQTLEQCLVSILRQTEINNIEILIKDGLSKDRTVNILRHYDKEIDYWESSIDTGVYDAWNKLLTNVTGNWVLFLGADDEMTSETIISEVFKEIDSSDRNIEIAYGKVNLIDKNGGFVLEMGKNWGEAKKCVRQKMCIPHQGIFHKKSLFDQHGNFNTKYSISADYDFLKRSLTDNNVIFLDKVVSNMRNGGISSNPDNIFMRLNETRSINKQHGSPYPQPLWLISYASASLRQIIFHIAGRKRGYKFLDLIRKIFGLPAYWTRL